jgi:uncharacterized membrane protein SpoIIM required for sporulation
LRKFILIALGIIFLVFVLIAGAAAFWFGYYCEGRQQYCYRLYMGTIGGGATEVMLDEVAKRM